MTRLIAILLAGLSIAGGGRAYAQESGFITVDAEVGSLEHCQAADSARDVRDDRLSRRRRHDEVAGVVQSGDAGGGLKWYANNGRWGVRGDYRFIAVRANDTAPAFFGQERRYGHRVYGAVIINAVR